MKKKDSYEMSVIFEMIVYVERKECMILRQSWLVVSMRGPAMGLLLYMFYSCLYGAAFCVA
jgi:hypothetical protein